MAVDITTEKEKYLWNTCSLTWGNLRKYWSEAEIASVAADISESFAYADKVIQSVNTNNIESFALGERTSNEMDLCVHELVDFAELLKKDARFNRAFNESILLVERQKNKTLYARLFNKSIGFGESFDRGVQYKRNPTEFFAISEMYWDNIDFVLRILEDIKVVDKRKISGSHYIEDDFSIFDQIKNRPLSNNADSFAVVDGFSRQAVFFIGFLENMNLADKHSDNIHYRRSALEQLGITDREDHTAVFRPILAELLGIQETYLDNIAFNIDIAENISVEDLLANKTQKPCVEKFSIVDYENNAFLLCYSEQLNLEELTKTYRPIIRKFFETIGFLESPQKNIDTNKKESFGVRDAIIRASNGVLSDIVITDSDMSFEEFKNAIDAPPLYSTFIDFKVGEYEYEQAIVKLKLSTTAQESLPSIVGCVMHVDIPDTDDRGTVEITDTTQPTKVHFNRHYYNPPEVNVNLKNGNTADGIIVPNIVSTEGKDNEGRYFEVELLDSSSNRTTGTISWVSKGY